uniref:Transcriptional repressor NF-X1 n=1 Tax=Schistocephalus solidus TaxID=70667 RepID=A0A0X3NM54_SCHSO
MRSTVEAVSAPSNPIQKPVSFSVATAASSANGSKDDWCGAVRKFSLYRLSGLRTRLPVFLTHKPPCGCDTYCFGALPSTLFSLIFVEALRLACVSIRQKQ